MSDDGDELAPTRSVGPPTRVRGDFGIAEAVSIAVEKPSRRIRLATVGFALVDLTVAVIVAVVAADL